MSEQFLHRHKYIWLLIGIGGLLVLQSLLPLVPSLPDLGGRPLPDYTIISRPPQWLNVFFDFFDFLQEDLGLVVVTRTVAQGIRFLLDVVNNVFLGDPKGFGLPALPWLTVVVIVFILGHYLQGLRLALLTSSLCSGRLLPPLSTPKI